MPTNLKPGNCTLKRTKLCTKIVININTCVRVGVGVGVGVDVDVGDGVGVGDDDGDGYINVAPTYQWPLLIKRNPRQVFLLTALARLASPSTNCTKRYFDTR